VSCAALGREKHGGAVAKTVLEKYFETPFAPIPERGSIAHTGLLLT